MSVLVIERQQGLRIRGRGVEEVPRLMSDIAGPESRYVGRIGSVKLRLLPATSSYETQLPMEGPAVPPHDAIRLLRG